MRNVFCILLMLATRWLLEVRPFIVCYVCPDVLILVVGLARGTFLEQDGDGLWGTINQLVFTTVRLPPVELYY